MMKSGAAILLFIILQTSAPGVEWDSIVRLTTNTQSQVLGYSYQRTITVDPGRNVWVFWLDYRSSPNQIWYRKFEWASGRWLPEAQLTASTVNCFTPSTTCDQSGNLHLVWHTEHTSSKGIWYKKFDAQQGRWFNDTLLEPAVYLKKYPVVVTKPGSEEIHIVWYGNPDTGGVPQVFHKQFQPDSGWLPAEQITSYPNTHSAATVAVDSLGNLCIVWVGREFNNTQDQIFCRRRINGVWTDIELVSEFPGSYLQTSPCVTAGTINNFHITWAGTNSSTYYSRIFYRRRTPEGFTPIFTVSEGLQFEQGSPSISCRQDNECHLAWRGRTATPPSPYQLIYASCDHLGYWTPPEPLTALTNGDVDNPSIICDSGLGLHIVWQDESSGNLDLYYLYGQVPGLGADETPCQIPSTVHTLPTVVRSSALSGFGSLPEIYDALGRKVRTRNLPQGVYLIQHPDSRTGKFQKLIIVSGGQ
ncbi:hypothetical protein HPY86_08525 [candidate division WOR-3 bacterium]|nr:hypothetical protein [candidate division WOR-3 bacterium]